MKKIKILQVENDGYYYDEYSNEELRKTIINSITDWEEISDEDYKKLTNAVALRYFQQKGLLVFTYQENQKEIIYRTIQDIGAEINRFEKESALREKQYKEQEKKRKELLAQKAEQKRLKAVEKAKKVLEDYEKNKNTKN